MCIQHRVAFNKLVSENLKCFWSFLSKRSVLLGYGTFLSQITFIKTQLDSLLYGIFLLCSFLMWFTALWRLESSLLMTGIQVCRCLLTSGLFYLLFKYLPWSFLSEILTYAFLLFTFDFYLGFQWICAFSLRFKLIFP